VVAVPGLDGSVTLSLASVSSFVKVVSKLTEPQAQLTEAVVVVP